MMITALLLSSLIAKSQLKDVVITLKNESSLAYVNKVVEIPWSSVSNNLKIDTAKMVVKDLQTGTQVPFQLEKKGTSEVVNLLVEVSLEANQQKSLSISEGKKAPVSPKVFGRYVPERKDDFAWENDKIAFRMYGKALEATPKENAYGIDVWVKRTDSLIINKRYRLGKYHVDQGDGMDYYHVGYTLGAGNMMPYLNDTIYYSKNYVDYKVLDNGPLRFSFQLIYDVWDVAGKKISATKTISLDAGSWLNKITVDYDGNNDTALNVVAGIITRKQAGLKFLDEQNGIMAYWEPTEGAKGTTGVACILTSPVSQMIEEGGQLLAKTVTNSEGTISYYQGATWDRQGTFKNSEQWISYLKTFKKSLEQPISVVVNK
ncbi:MAG TPA: DUF4861 family protein [Pelobium sp.]|nr:DUF4861 family protein [Pelobium sp.]